MLVDGGLEDSLGLNTGAAFGVLPKPVKLAASDNVDRVEKG